MTRPRHRSTATDGPAGRPPGRPRDPSIDDAVARAVIELLEKGVAANEMTMVQVAEAAGISRTSLYRRHERIEEVLAAALDSVRRPIDEVDTGSLGGDLTALYDTASTAVETTPLARELTVLRIGLGLHDPAFRALAWERHLSQRRAPMVRAIRRATERGEIPPDTDPDIIVDLINGAGYYQLVVRPDDGGGTARLHAAIDLLVRCLTGGISRADPSSCS
ncbi:MAG: TetR/AcrR family transcriptional regulator [Nitriliruptoraceae bacterium]